MRGVVLLAVLFVVLASNVSGECVVAAKWVGQWIDIEGCQTDSDSASTCLRLRIVKGKYDGKYNEILNIQDTVLYELQYYRMLEEGQYVVMVSTFGEFQDNEFWSQPTANLNRMRLNAVISATNSVDGTPVEIPIDLELWGRNRGKPDRTIAHNFSTDPDYILSHAVDVDQPDGNLAIGNVGQFNFTDSGCASPPCSSWEYDVDMHAASNLVIQRASDDSILCRKGK